MGLDWMAGFHMTCWYPPHACSGDANWGEWSVRVAVPQRSAAVGFTSIQYTRRMDTIHIAVQ